MRHFTIKIFKFQKLCVQKKNLIVCMILCKAFSVRSKVYSFNLYSSSSSGSSAGFGGSGFGDSSGGFGGSGFGSSSSGG